MRNRLGDLLDPGTIARAFEAEHGTLSWADLETLAFIENFHRENMGGADHG